jgi:HlyD family secretion protein
LEKKLEERNIFHKSCLNEWQRQVTEYEYSNKKYRNEIDELKEDIMNYFILAPGSGHIINFSGIRQGSYVNLGQNIASISPDDSLTVETLVQPKDIGYLTQGMQVIYTVDAFNYHQWGFASGSIASISNEVHLIENHPFFKVRCNLNEKQLFLKNGYKGELKKGLTATVRFVITKRTLAQLLFDKTQNWLNPNMKDSN